MNIQKTNEILNTRFGITEEWDHNVDGRCGLTTVISACIPPATAGIMLSTGDDKICRCERRWANASMPLPDFLRYISRMKGMIEEFLEASKDTIHEIPPEILDEVWLQYERNNDDLAF